MIDPGQLSEYLAAVRDVYGDAERALAKAVGRAARDYLTDDEKAAQAALVRLRRDAAEQVARLDEDGVAAVDRAVRAAGLRGADLADADIRQVRRAIRPRDSGVNVQALDALARSAVDMVTPANRSVLRTIVDDFRRVIARATAGILGGYATQREAAQRAVWAWADQGIASFTDRSGRRWQITSYAEMATRTAGIRAMVDGHMDRLDDAGIRLVYVSDHREECHLCAPWEGRVLARTGAAGVVQVPSEVDDRLVTVDVAGTVAEARIAGLFHPNCRHSLNAYLPGLTQVPEDTDDEEGREARQRQRAIERNIRKWKGREASAMDPHARALAERKVRQWQGAMRDHLREHPTLRRLREREAPGAGFAPTETQKRREGEAFPATPLKDLTDDELADRYVEALGDGEHLDEALLDAINVEEQRREALAVRRGRDRERRADANRRKLDEIGRLIEEEGMDERAAVEEVTGRTVEQQRRDEAIATLRRNGYSGGSFDDLARQSYADHLYREFIRAEDDDRVKGTHVSREGKARGIDDYAVWSGSEAFARRWASEELRGYWDEEGRPTLNAWKAQLLDDPAAMRRERQNRQGRGDFLQ